MSFWVSALSGGLQGLGAGLTQRAQEERDEAREMRGLELREHYAMLRQKDQQDFYAGQNEAENTARAEQAQLDRDAREMEGRRDRAAEATRWQHGHNLSQKELDLKKEELAFRKEQFAVEQQLQQIAQRANSSGAGEFTLKDQKEVFELFSQVYQVQDENGEWVPDFDRIPQASNFWRQRGLVPWNHTVTGDEILVAAMDPQYEDVAVGDINAAAEKLKSLKYGVPDSAIDDARMMYERMEKSRAKHAGESGAGADSGGFSNLDDWLTWLGVPEAKSPQGLWSGHSGETEDAPPRASGLSQYDSFMAGTPQQPGGLLRPPALSARPSVTGPPPVFPTPHHTPLPSTPYSSPQAPAGGPLIRPPAAAPAAPPQAPPAAQAPSAPPAAPTASSPGLIARAIGGFDAHITSQQQANLARDRAQFDQSRGHAPGSLAPQTSPRAEHVTVTGTAPPPQVVQQRTRQLAEAVLSSVSGGGKAGASAQKAATDLLEAFSNPPAMADFDQLRMRLVEAISKLPVRTRKQVESVILSQQR